MNDPTRSRTHGFVPPYLLERLAADADPALAGPARRTLDGDDTLRRARERPDLWGQWADPSGAVVPGAAESDAVESDAVESPEPDGQREPGPLRVVSDARGGRELPGTAVRREAEDPTGDPAADEAYDGLGDTWQLFFDAFGRDSLDGRGMPLLATVHFDRDYDNAFWDGVQMVFGDGDGRIFNRFTLSLDVIGHELAHGVTEHTAGLMYRDQPGALNESVSDVFGSLVRQRVLGQSAREADWLIGADLFTDAVQGDALRSMKAPGTAYDDPVLGKDPQPGHLDDYVRTAEDNGGVHINSGIPNRAFYETAVALGGNAWEAPGQIWYDTLTGDIRADCDFTTFAQLTLAAATDRYGADSAEVAAVRHGWEAVGVLTGQGSDAAGAEEPAPDPATDPVPEGGAEPAPAGAELLLRRSGGFAGLVREREVRLDELPEPDTRDWRHLLGGQRLRALQAPGGEASRGGHPDAFTYRVCCDAVDLDVTVTESHLPHDVRGLFERTLEQPG